MLLIGRNLSPYTRRVAVSLGLLGIEFERKPLTAWHDLDEVRRMNPVGRVPALVLDDGEVLFDSSAILDYLDELAGSGKALMPPAGAERREVQRLTVAALGVMDKAAAARYELVMRPEEKVHKPWLEHNQGQVGSGLDWLEHNVSGPWLTGERLTQADVTLVAACDFLTVFDDSLFPPVKYPRLHALVAKANELAPFADTHPAGR